MSNSMSSTASPSQMVLSILSKLEVITSRRSRVIKPDPDLDRNKLKITGLSVQKLRAGLNTLPPEVRTMVYSHFFKDTTSYNPIEHLWHRISANHVLYNEVVPTTEQHTGNPEFMYWNKFSVFDPRISLVGPNYLEEFLGEYYRVQEVALRAVQWHSQPKCSSTNFGYVPNEVVWTMMAQCKIFVDFGYEAMQSGPEHRLKCFKLVIQVLKRAPRLKNVKIVAKCRAKCVMRPSIRSRRCRFEPIDTTVYPTAVTEMDQLFRTELHDPAAHIDSNHIIGDLDGLVLEYQIRRTPAADEAIEVTDQGDISNAPEAVLTCNDPETARKRKRSDSESIEGAGEADDDRRTTRRR